MQLLVFRVSPNVADCTMPEVPDELLDQLLALVDRLRERGAIVIPAAPFQPQVVTSGRVVTGQNPASAEGVGLAMVKLLGT